MTLRLTSHVAESQPVKVFLPQWDGSLGSKFSKMYFILTFYSEMRSCLTLQHQSHRVNVIIADKTIMVFNSNELLEH